MSVLNVNVSTMVNKILKDVHVAHKSCQAQGTLSRTETLGIDIASSPIKMWILLSRIQVFKNKDFPEECIDHLSVLFGTDNLERAEAVMVFDLHRNSLLDQPLERVVVIVGDGCVEASSRHSSRSCPCRSCSLDKITVQALKALQSKRLLHYYFVSQLLGINCSVNIMFSQ